MAASYNFYRNLTVPDHFSIRLRNKVVDHSTEMIAYNCRFHVNESGRRRVVERRRKTVIAYVVGQSYEKGKQETEGYEELYFDPYFTQFFMSLKTGKPVRRAERVVFANNRCYAAGVLD